MQSTANYAYLNSVALTYSTDNTPISRDYFRSLDLGTQWNSNLRYTGIKASLPATL